MAPSGDIDAIKCLSRFIGAKAGQRVLNSILAKIETEGRINSYLIIERADFRRVARSILGPSVKKRETDAFVRQVVRAMTLSPEMGEPPLVESNSSCVVGGIPARIGPLTERGKALCSNMGRRLRVDELIRQERRALEKQAWCLLKSLDAESYSKIRHIVAGSPIIDHIPNECPDDMAQLVYEAVPKRALFWLARGRRGEYWTTKGKRGASPSVLLCPSCRRPLVIGEIGELSAVRCKRCGRDRPQVIPPDICDTTCPSCKPSFRFLLHCQTLDCPEEMRPFTLSAEGLRRRNVKDSEVPHPDQAFVLREALCVFWHLPDAYEKVLEGLALKAGARRLGPRNPGRDLVDLILYYPTSGRVQVLDAKRWRTSPPNRIRKGLMELANRWPRIRTIVRNLAEKEGIDVQRIELCLVTSSIPKNLSHPISLRLPGGGHLRLLSTVDLVEPWSPSEGMP